jgi:hypothetical protein
LLIETTIGLARGAQPCHFTGHGLGATADPPPVSSRSTTASIGLVVQRLGQRLGQVVRVDERCSNPAERRWMAPWPTTSATTASASSGTWFRRLA